MNTVAQALVTLACVVGCTRGASRDRKGVGRLSPGDDCVGVVPRSECTGPESAAECVAGKVVARVCRGPMGCWARPGNVWCDARLGAVGETCASGEACAPDGKTLLQCGSTKKLEEKLKCLGQRGCKLDDDYDKYSTPGLLCDHPSIAKAGESCAYEGQVTCDAGGLFVVRCGYGDGVYLEWRRSETCGAVGCKMTDDGLDAKCN